MGTKFFHHGLLARFIAQACISCCGVGLDFNRKKVGYFYDISVIIVPMGISCHSLHGFRWVRILMTFTHISTYIVTQLP